MINALVAKLVISVVMVLKTERSIPNFIVERVIIRGMNEYSSLRHTNLGPYVR